MRNDFPGAYLIQRLEVERHHTPKAERQRRGDHALAGLAGLFRAALHQGYPVMALSKPARYAKCDGESMGEADECKRDVWGLRTRD